MNDTGYTQQDFDKLFQRNEKLENECRQLKERLDLLMEENNKLETELHKLKKNENVEFYNERTKTYDLKLHLCIYSLLDNHVAYQNVGAVIENSTKPPNKLPAISTIQNWSLERGILARKQIVGTAVDTVNTTLHTDEASKYGSKWGALATRDSEGNNTFLGLRDMATKSSHDTLETFKNILSDIDSVCSNNESPAQKIICYIRNTMTSTETKFNELLAEYRTDILPNVREKYEEMSENEKAALSRMNNFFCGHHTLMHMADVSAKSLYEVKKGHFKNEIPIHNVSFSWHNSYNLNGLQIICQKKRSKIWLSLHFVTFITQLLKDNQMRGLPLQPLKGNRFNILFTNAGHVYFLKSQMIAYLESCPALNGLLQSVIFDLRQPFFIIGCKSLGLISKHITTPLWNIIENQEVSISDMNIRYVRLINYIAECVENLDDFIREYLLLYDDVPVKRDKMYEKLIKPSEIDCHVIVILSVIFPNLIQLIQRQFGSHLPGGSNEHINEHETSSVDKHNQYPERVFSYADHILSSKPNIKTLALEAFSLNKTHAWLSQREEVLQLIEESRKEVETEKKKLREEEISRKRSEKQQEEFVKKEDLERE
ncbi:LOW QUALITY PROTEIN: hypothetical protein MAR_030044 [Mya arenaria]|uniref:Uncharacterized protein n=1 Tax=Mya arenaria TaxID=6604 RepID=A0ABY7DLG8_MYAAR|nr:LOW QUALITY PROTEIN: hypothetical protein MAR_030044 [Mya arenaria]